MIFNLVEWPSPEQNFAVFKSRNGMLNLLVSRLCPLPSILNNMIGKLFISTMWKYGGKYPLSLEL